MDKMWSIKRFKKMIIEKRQKLFFLAYLYLNIGYKDDPKRKKKIVLKKTEKKIVFSAL